LFPFFFDNDDDDNDDDNDDHDNNNDDGVTITTSGILPPAGSHPAYSLMAYSIVTCYSYHF
jgi:hypothetical protein